MRKILFFAFLAILISNVNAQQFPKQFRSATVYSYPLDYADDFLKDKILDSSKIISIKVLHSRNYSFLDTLLKNSEILEKISDLDDYTPFFIIEGHTYEHGTDTLYFYHHFKKYIICKFNNTLYKLDKFVLDNVLNIMPYYHYLHFRKKYFDL